MSKIIDVHTHAFPDRIAQKTIKHLEAEGNIKAALDGTIDSLLDSMKKAKVSVSVLSSIATKVSQFDSILQWSKEIASDRIIPFPSVHPEDPKLLEKVDIIAGEGFKGIKLHPYYQNFVINETRLFPLYKRIQEKGLILLFHTGFDVAFARDRIADPIKVIDIKEHFPGLTFIASHLGGWEDWCQVQKYIIGKEIYIDISYSLNNPMIQQPKKMLLDHPKEYILFGSDSPWADQEVTVRLVKQLRLGTEIENHLFYKNAQRLLKID